MHSFSENKERADFGNRFGGGGGGGGGGAERNCGYIECINCRFGFYYNWSTSSTFKELKTQKKKK